MADPRVKTDTKPITMRFPLDVAEQLIDLAKQYDKPQVQVLNDLIRTAHARLVKKENKRA